MFFNRKGTEKRSSPGVERIRNILNETLLNNSSETETTYFSCIKIISESVAKTSIKIKRNTEKGYDYVKHSWSNCLEIRANPNMSITDCIQTLVRYTKHYGIGALYIDRDNHYLYPVRINNIIVDNIGLIKSSKINKVLYTVQDASNSLMDTIEDNLIILKDNPIDGINCKSTRSICDTSLQSAISANNYLKELFSNGLTNKLAVQCVSDIQDEEKLLEIQDRFNRMYSLKGRIFTIPAEYRVAPLNLSLADSQFTDLKKLSKQEIAVAMGVPLSKLGIKQETAKSNEQDNLDFLTDTLQIIFTKLEKEMAYKLFTNAEQEQGYSIEFNVGGLLRLDAKTQAEVVTMYAKQGIYSLNEAKEILHRKQLDKDVTLFPSGQVTLEMLQNGEVSYGKSGPNKENITENNSSKTQANNIEKVPEKILNGAQVQAVVSVIESISNGTLTEEQGINIVSTSFNLDKEVVKK